MIKRKLNSQNDPGGYFEVLNQAIYRRSKNNQRVCPSCELLTLRGMPGGPDSICKNCGYKDPCCYD